MNPYVIILGILVLVALAAVIWAVRDRRRGTPPPLDLSDNAYAAAVRKWQRDYPRGLDSRADFPSVADWKAEQAWQYYDEHGVWPKDMI